MVEQGDLLARQSIWQAVYDELDDLDQPERKAAADRLVFRLRRLLEAQSVRELRRGLSFKATWLLELADGLAPESDRSHHDQPAP